PPAPTVLAIKLQAINRHIEHFEGTINQIETGADKVLELGDATLPAVTSGFREVLAGAWQPAPSTSVVAADLAAAEKELGQDYAAKKAGLEREYEFELRRLALAMEQEPMPEERILAMASVVGVALAVFDTALVPAR